jgi:hypothetical protein
MIRYFVSYTMQDSYSFGSGNCEISWSRPITSMQDIRELTTFLRNAGIDGPVVMSFTRFDAEAGETR